VVGASAAIGRSLAACFPFLSNGRERLAVLPPGIDSPPYAPPPPGPFRIGVVARLDAVKGHSVLLEALAKIRDRLGGAEIAIAGEEKGVKRADLEVMARRLGIDRFLSWRGRLPDVLEFMRSCAAGVVPSVGSEAVSRAALEWMASGRALVASRVGALPELVAEELTGRLVNPGDPEDLSRGIRFLLERRETAEKWGMAGWEKAVRFHSSDRWAGETADFYSRALAART
jgi:glycosyltransferase involved in cell wall biosynthesis